SKCGVSAVIKSFLRRMAQMRRCFLTKCTIWVGDDKNTKQMSCYAKEIGRSMVEMLGVLAIIGVLSVGGIAGYSKAMEKYKLNKHAQSFNFLLNMAIQYSGTVSSSSDYTENNNIFYTGTFYKAGLVPDGFELEKNSTVFLRDMFDNLVWLFENPSSKSSGLGYEFTSDELNICYNIFNIIKYNSFQLYTVSTDSRDSESQIATSNGILSGDSYCVKDKKCIKDMTINDIDTLCNNCASSHSSCRIFVKWLY
ncbi:MAG: hypothetical protein IJ019_04250, partial [Alphaproteobacteria bacterium]|nr:hypothetical protein [Alphaproteobacteria bacterium]